MNRLPFVKMHGAGNDYVFVDGFAHPVPPNPQQLARRVANRNFGVGGDGLVLMLPAETPDCTARMRMFNADGSESGLCGNALRCMVLWLHYSGRCGTHCRIRMGERLIEATILSFDRESGTGRVRMSVGSPQLLDNAAPDRCKYVRTAALPGLELPRLVIPPVHVSMGNPHTVLFVEDLRSCDVHRTGAAIERHGEFPDRTNVEFVQIASRSSAVVRVWERGSGETLACGSGACAVTVAGIARGLLDDSEPVVLRMLGGDLSVTWQPGDIVDLEGPAAISFFGELPLTDL